MLGDAGQLLGATVEELVPPEAQVHLLNAQRELLLAITAILEHHRRTREPGTGRPRRRRPVKVDVD